jgi:hypothetical protein
MITPSPRWSPQAKAEKKLKQACEKFGLPASDDKDAMVAALEGLLALETGAPGRRPLPAGACNGLPVALAGCKCLGVNAAGPRAGVCG